MLTLQTRSCLNNLVSGNTSVSFDEKCYKLLSRVPRGKVTTYKELARAIGTKAYRAVGQAMNRNQKLISIPCHRVVKSNGEIGGYALGVDRKIELLVNEGIQVRLYKVSNFPQAFFRFD